MEKQPYTNEQLQEIRNGVIDALRTVYDPEIPVNIYDLGLIYAVELDDAGNVDVTMTLTSPMCPVAETLPLDVENRAQAVEGVGDVNVNLVWEPQWTMDMMSEDAKLELGF
ncbi:MAG: SUF system Fe-S cluster assembly protein [bacterium]|jgi:FeS assembly SUF system protein|nr:SUF system Fe-S cluster assembly protein [bacterium]